MRLNSTSDVFAGAASKFVQDARRIAITALQKVGVVAKSAKANDALVE